MSGAGGDGAGYIPAAELAELVDNLTIEDVRLSRDEYPEGDPMRGFAAVYHAARRTGLANGADLSGFLSRVRLRDLAPLLEASASGNAPSGSSSSPTSADTGA